MGDEFIPFDSTSAAENFMKDHQGKKIFSFAEITLEQVTRLRSGMTMKKKEMHNHSMKTNHSN